MRRAVARRCVPRRSAVFAQRRSAAWALRFPLRRALRAVGLGALVAASLGAASARAAVRVDDGEVIFTLRAPHARSVFLAGSFNAWNPTVEPMERDGDVFRVSLFLVEGTWHYRFVVDGRWIDDPDNPAPEGEPGSRLVLVERDGEVMLAAGSVAPPARPGWTPAVRVRAEAARGDRPALDADFAARVAREALGARAVVRTRARAFDDAGERDAWIEHARVTLRSGALRVAASRADSSGLEGDGVAPPVFDGRFGYLAGLSRTGVTVSLRPGEALEARLRWDRPAEAGDAAASIGRVAGRPAGGDTIGAAVTSFAGGVSDADRIAADVVARVDRARVGWSLRTRRGALPGWRDEIVAPNRVVRRRTSERHRAWSAWARVDGIAALRSVVVEAGAGALWLDAVDADSVASGAPPGADSSAASSPVAPDVHDRFATTRRVRVALGPVEGAHRWRVAWTHERFDFARTPGLAREAEARVDRVRAVLVREGRRVDLSASARWTRIDAAVAPDAFHPDVPARNPWLGLRDVLDPADIVALDARTITDAAAAVVARPSGVDTLGVRAAVALARGGVRRALVHAGAAKTFAGAWTVFVDGRLVRYDRSRAAGAIWMGSGYAEIAWRRGPVEASVGWGFDPVQWDPVVDAWTPTARERFLRRALESPFGRSRAEALRRAWIAREREFQDAQRVHVELVLRF